LTANADIQNFTHEDLAVQVGTTVVWANQDGAPHTTTEAEGQWDSGILQQGESFSFTFTDVGVFSYRCDIHRTMTGEVTVNN
jgi:plastocyanin